jgi:FAD/FMN-containing dehydrogenase
MLAGWEDPSEADKNIDWARRIYDTMRPSLHAGIYLNGLGLDSAPQVTAAFRPETYERLLALKRKYDPTNLFHLNPNIDPGV